MKRVKNEKALSSKLSSSSSHVKPKPPLYPAEYLYGILNPQNKNSFDIKKVIESVNWKWDYFVDLGFQDISNIFM